MMIVKKIKDPWMFELEVFKWMANLNWFVIYEWSMSLKFKGDHKGFYWSWWIFGLKLLELNVYSNRHDKNTFDK